MKTFVAQLRGALANIRFKIHQQFVDGDTVISQWTLRAVHRGELFGVPATGHPIAVRGMCVETFANGRSVDMSGVEDRLGAFQQTGSLTIVLNR